MSTDLQTQRPRLPNGQFVPVPLTPASSYFAKHGKIRRTRGSASKYPCACGCGQQAAQWATLHGRTGLDIQNDYQPMTIWHHMLYDGTSVCLRRGEDVAGAKLTAARVLELRELHATGSWTLQRLADRFGVSPTTVYNITGRKTAWRWLTAAAT